MVIMYSQHGKIDGDKFAKFIETIVPRALTTDNNQYWTYIRRNGMGGVFDNNEIKPQLKSWKNLKVECLKCNFRTYKFDNKEFYYFIIQPTDENDNAGIDPISMNVPDINGKYSMVDGYGYFSRSEANREAIWKYLGSKE